MFAQLVPVEGGTPITVERDVSVVGRQREGCDIVIDRKSVSKIHCILVKTDGLLFIRDLFSTNGTKVNGQKITRGALLPGDTLSLAGEKFRIHLGPSPAVSVQPLNERTMEMAYPPVLSDEVVSLPLAGVDPNSGAGMKFVRLPPGGVPLEMASHEDLVE